MARWQRAADADEPLDLLRETRRLALRVVLAEFFDDADRSDFDAFETVVGRIEQSSDLRALYATLSIPAGDRKRLLDALESREGLLIGLERYLDDLLNRPAASGDSFFVRAKSDPKLSHIEPGADDRALRDIASTFIFAGYGTTAAALFWSLVTFARHPEARPGATWTSIPDARTSRVPSYPTSARSGLAVWRPRRHFSPTPASSRFTGTSRSRP